jgi:hypothetical protein
MTFKSSYGNLCHGMTFMEGLVKSLAFHRYEAASAQPLSQVSYDLQIKL